MSKYTEAFTLVFKGDIRSFKMNPLTTETPWGIPYAVSMGDVLEVLAKAEAEIERLRDAKRRALTIADERSL